MQAVAESIKIGPIVETHGGDIAEVAHVSQGLITSECGRGSLSKTAAPATAIATANI